MTPSRCGRSESPLSSSTGTPDQGCSVILRYARRFVAPGDIVEYDGDLLSRRLSG